MVKCNTREYAAICVDMEGILTSKKEERELHSKHNMAFQRSMLREWWWTVGEIFCEFWPLNLLCLVETPITIFEQYFRFDANLEINFPFFRNGKRDLLLLDITAWK